MFIIVEAENKKPRTATQTAQGVMGSSNSFALNYPQAKGSSIYGSPSPQESEVHALVDLVSSLDNGQIFQLLRYILLQSLPHKIRKRGLGDGESSSPRGLVSCWNDSDAEYRGTKF